jgi:hypothetical protein
MLVSSVSYADVSTYVPNMTGNKALGDYGMCNSNVCSSFPLDTDSGDLSDANKNQMSVDDGTRFYHGGPGGWHAAAVSFNITETADDISKINITLNGYGDGWFGPGARFFLYNYTASAYNQFDTSSGSSDDDHVASTTSISDYLNSENNLTVLFVSESVGAGFGAEIYIDLIEMTVEYTSCETVTPNITFVNPTTAHGNYSQSWIEANVTATDDIELDQITIYLYNDTGLVRNISKDVGGLKNTSFFNFTGLNNGAYYLNATVNDTCDNTNKTETRTIVLEFTDTVNPSISYGSPTTAAGTYGQNYIEANITASDSNLDTITVYLYNSTDLVRNITTASSPNYYNFTNLHNGTYYLNATVNDTYGNTNKTSTRTIILDLDEPDLVFETPTTSAGVVNQNWIFANVSATDSASIDSITIYLYNVSEVLYKNYTSTTDNPYSYNFTGLLNGKWYLNATANDSYGNIGKLATRTIVLNFTDTVDPSIPTSDQAAIPIFFAIISGVFIFLATQFHEKNSSLAWLFTFAGIILIIVNTTIMSVFASTPELESMIATGGIYTSIILLMILFTYFIVIFLKGILSTKTEKDKRLR